MLVHYKSSGFYSPYSTTQQGASVGGIVFMLLALGIIIKLAIAILPAQVGDYQLNKLIASQLKKANDANASAAEFMKTLEQQLNLNGSYDTKPNEILTFVNKTPGNLVVNKSYVVEKNFIGNVAIVNKFEGEITGNDAK